MREAWQREVARGFVGVDMHLPTPEGGMGPYGTRMYRPSSATYVEGVELWLRFQQDLEVTVTRR